MGTGKFSIIFRFKVPSSPIFKRILYSFLFLYLKINAGWHLNFNLDSIYFLSFLTCRFFLFHHIIFSWQTVLSFHFTVWCLSNTDFPNTFLLSFIASGMAFPWPGNKIPFHEWRPLLILWDKGSISVLVEGRGCLFHQCPWHRKEISNVFADLINWWTDFEKLYRLTLTHDKDLGEGVSSAHVWNAWHFLWLCTWFHFCLSVCLLKFVSSVIKPKFYVLLCSEAGCDFKAKIAAGKGKELKRLPYS